METTIQDTNRKERPKVGVVLGTGGIKAFAAIPLFELLDQQQIDIDLLIGSSGGSLLCAARAAGYTPAEMRDLTRLWDRSYTSEVDYRSLMGVAHPRLSRSGSAAAILKPQKIQQLLRRLFKDLRVEDLNPKTRLIATDLHSGEPVVLSSGPVTEAVYASSACFPLLPAARKGGQWLIDGAFSAPLPVMEAVKRGMDVIIAVDFEQRVATEPKGFLDFFHRSFSAMSRALTQSQMALSVELHHHQIVMINIQYDETVHLWDSRETPMILASGEKSIAQKKNDILSAVQSFSGARR